MNDKTTFELSENVLGIIIDQRVSTQVMEEILAEIEERIKCNKKIRFFLEIKGGNKISLAAFWKDLNFKCKHDSDFRKVAVVTDIQWFKEITGLKDNFMEADIRAFNNEDRLRALNWITE
ncbi:STAS/SEC14 domain-containing protein [Zunongwangia endophytica]|uniref:STAS/SEC14 domain-containing protein n=1 Tax=Zunongwangia endophytica TaxID=1808945 RepID=A0ABV8H4W8_9FLAO|nr:STAS/SEC14 domain-containing protein [Zunongwangia endophytica]MDN3595394.1 STAS/SEC14 domain-containing protein [Zunongwangia endophytica]